MSQDISHHLAVGPKPEQRPSEGTELYRRASRMLEGTERGDSDGQEQKLEDANGSAATHGQQESNGDGNGTRERAIDLLIKSVRAGSSQARELLEETLRKGRGIGYGNIVEVLSTIQSQTTDPVVLAAREIFTALATPGTKVQGAEDFKSMSAKQLEAVLEEKFNTPDQAPADDQKDAIQSIIEKTKKLGDGDEAKVSEQEFLAVAISYANGELPGGNLQALRESDRFSKLGWIERAQLDPLKTAKYIAKHSLHMVEDKGERWLVRAVPYHQMAYILFLYVMTYIVVPRVMWHFVPKFLFYGALAFMLIGTLQQIWFQRLFRLYHVFSVVFGRFNSKLDVAFYEAAFVRKNGAHSVVIFLSAYAVIAGVRPLAQEIGILNETVVLLAVLFAALSFLACSGCHVREVRWSAALRLASAVLALACSAGTVPSPPPPLDAVLCPWFSVPIGGTGVVVTVGPQAALQAAAAALLVAAGVRLGRASWLQIVLPHLFFVSWLDLAALLLPGCCMYGFGQAVAAVASIPLLPVIVTFAPLYLASRGGVVAIGLILVAMVAVAGALLVLARALDVSKVRAWFSRLQSTTQALLLGGFALGVVTALALAHSSYSSSINPMASRAVLPVTWQYYNDKCNAANSSVAMRQLACLHFNRQLVQWNGTVTGLRITEVDNSVRSTLTAIPWGLGYYFYWLGFPDSGSCPDAADSLDCTLHQVAMSHLDLVNTYKFALTVRMSQPEASVVVAVGHHLLPNVRHITDGTLVRFKAVIGDAGSDKGPSLLAKMVSVIDADGNGLYVSQIPQGQRSVTEELDRAGRQMIMALGGFTVRMESVDDQDAEDEVVVQP